MECRLPMRVDNASVSSQICAKQLRWVTERHCDVHPPLSHLDSPEALGDQRPHCGHCREFRARAGPAHPPGGISRPGGVVSHSASSAPVNLAGSLGRTTTTRVLYGALVAGVV